MKLKNIGLFLGMLLLSATTYANLRSSSITLTSGTIKPHETLTITTTPLLPDVRYEILCKINDPNNANNKVYIKVEAKSSYWGIYLNGCYISGSQCKLSQEDNTLEFLNILNDNTFSITNLDDTDSIIVTTVATPQEYH